MFMSAIWPMIPLQVGELIAVMAEDGEDWKEVAKTAGQGGAGEAPAAQA